MLYGGRNIEMDRDEIGLVTDSWRNALSQPDVLFSALTERLDGTDRFRTERARWIVDAVSALSEVLDHPATFEPRAAEVLARRSNVTVEELGTERDALLAALTELDPGMTTETARAWQLAIGLFAELVAAVGLEPFKGDRESPS
jgi:hemoglobin-like flavoprotein